MKVYKTEPNEYGWYLVIHRTNDGVLKLFKKCIYKKHRRFESDFMIWEKDGLKLLKKVLNKKKENLE